MSPSNIYYQIVWPVYIISKGRADQCFTADIFEQEGLEFNIVVEPQDEQEYTEKYGEENILVMGDNDKGIAFVRNWVRRYSIMAGEKYHWCVDDNVKSFRHRVNKKNEKTTALYCLSRVEDYVNNHTNIGAAGLSHMVFAFARTTDFGINQQLYSCVLFRNCLDIWYRKDIVEDTDFSMQILTHDECYWSTVIFFRLLIDKATTMTMKGGNTEVTYGEDGRRLRVDNLIKQWPEVFKVKMKDGEVRVAPSRVWKSFKQRPEMP